MPQAQATDWQLPIHLANARNKSSGDLTDADSDSWRMALYTDTWVLSGYDRKTTGSYNVGPFSNAGEVTTTGTDSNWSSPGGQLLSGVTMQTGAGGEICWVANNPVIGAGGALTFNQAFSSGTVYSSTAASKWTLCFINFGGLITLTAPGSVTVVFPTTPMGVTNTSGTMFYFS